jgi:uncharacterized protein (DUF58 family)
MIEAILQRVSRIPLPIRRLAQHARLGRHQSHKSGSGLDFDRIKEYQAGETVRKVNWTATARKGSLIPLINTYHEEKAITVMLLVDLSAPMDFGSTRLTKRMLVAEVSASLVYSALAMHDRIGFLGFASDVTCYLPPRQSWTYQRLIPDHILTCQARNTPANFGLAVDHLEKWVKYPSLVFLLSDFLMDDPAELRWALTHLHHKHDPIALVVTDPREETLPVARARLVTHDLETGKRESYSFTRRNQRHMEACRRSRETTLHEVFQRLGLLHLTVTPTSNYIEDLTQLFLTCHRRASA